MKKKGFTVVELVVTFVLTATIAIFLFQIVMVLKNLYISYGTKTELLNKQSLISYNINDSFKVKKLSTITKCGSYCLNFIYADNSIKKLEINTNNNTFTFGDYKTVLPEDSHFGSINIDAYFSPVFDTSKKDAMLLINIPIYNDLLKDQDFGVRVVYQYLSSSTNITSVSFDEEGSIYGSIALRDKNEINVPNGVAYVDPGYLLFDKDGNVINDSSLIEIENPFAGLSLPYLTGKYDFKYHLKNNVGNIIDTKIRTVNVENSTYDFSYTGTSQTFTVPVSGKYKVELWGASGGRGNISIDLNGKGGYTEGTITLNKDTDLYIFVGENGYVGNNGPVSNLSGGIGGSATFNGGGAGGSAAYGDVTYPASSYRGGASGGGATDIRLTNGSWNDTSSLNSRIIVAGGGGGGASVGENVNSTVPGEAGGLNSYIGMTNTYYPDKGGEAASQTTGFSFGIGDVGDNTGSDTYCNGHSGGGGGYYGGFGGNNTGANCYIIGGAGGSSFISGHTGCVAITSNSNQTPKTGCTTGTATISCSYHYSGYKFTDTKMIDGAGYNWTNVKGSLEQMPNPDGGSYASGVGHTGNGYVRITYLGQ